MLNSVPEQCFYYLKHNFNENIVYEIAEIFKKLYGNFPGSKMSENQRSFVSSFFKKIENEEVLRIIKKIEGDMIYFTIITVFKLKFGLMIIFYNRV